MHFLATLSTIGFPLENFSVSIWFNGLIVCVKFKQFTDSVLLAIL